MLYDVIFHVTYFTCLFSLTDDNQLRMKECTSFIDGKNEQRFSIMYEELQSVCSKFSKGLYLYFSIFRKNAIQFTQAVVQRCSVKKVFLEISQNSQERPVSESLF